STPVKNRLLHSARRPQQPADQRNLFDDTNSILQSPCLFLTEEELYWSQPCFFPRSSSFSQPASIQLRQSFRDREGANMHQNGHISSGSRLSTIPFLAMLNSNKKRK